MATCVQYWKAANSGHHRPLSICIVSGLNYRYAWWPHIAIELQIAALGIAAAGILVTVWAMATNAFFHGVERAGKDGHTLCTSGPYQFLRHPSALGVLVFNLSKPLVLGSIWALIPVMVVVGEVVLNTTREDRTLQRELHGYKQYSQIVRYRLLPRVW